MNHQMIFVNLPVADLPRSRAFFSELGYSFNDKFCDDNALCVELGPNLYAMLLRTDFFAGFTTKQVADSERTAQVLLALSAESREQVDQLADKALDLGAEVGDTEDHGFMYGRSFYDLDGHGWEIVWMDEQAAAIGPEEWAAQHGSGGEG